MSDPFVFNQIPDEYAVMGNPIAHSKSPQIHSLFAIQTGQNLRYHAIQVDPGGFSQAVGNFVAHGGKGLNITVPFKTEAWLLANQLSERGKIAGAINTIKVLDNGQLYGDNTDGIGLVCDLIDRHGITITGKSLLLIGAGGAARGVLGPLLDEHPHSLVIANRTVDRAQQLASLYTSKSRIHAVGFSHLSDQRFDIVINATSASLSGEVPPLPVSCVRDSEIVYDMMYGAAPTPFLLWARQAGAHKTRDGLGMLVEQAAESFFVWRGIKPDTAPVIAQLRKQLK